MQIGYLKKVVPAENQYRFYNVHIAPTLFGEWSMIREWGRIGQAGQVQVRTFPAEDVAIDAGAKQLIEKQRRGYQHLSIRGLIR